MKCLQDKVTGKVTRVSDKDAIKKVASGKYEFVAKHIWKEKTRKISELKVDAVETATEVKVHGLKAKDRKKQK